MVRTTDLGWNREDCYSGVLFQTYLEFLLPVCKLCVCTWLLFYAIFHPLYPNHCLHSQVMIGPSERQPSIGLHRNVRLFESHLGRFCRRRMLELWDFLVTRVTPAWNVPSRAFLPLISRGRFRTLQMTLRLMLWLWSILRLWFRLSLWV